MQSRKHLAFLFVLALALSFFLGVGSDVSRAGLPCNGAIRPDWISCYSKFNQLCCDNTQ